MTQNHGEDQIQQLTRAVAELSVTVVRMADRVAVSEQRVEDFEKSVDQRAMAAAASVAAALVNLGYEQAKAAEKPPAEPAPPPGARRRGMLWLVPAVALFTAIMHRPMTSLAVVAAAGGLFIAGGLIWPDSDGSPRTAIAGPTTTVSRLGTPRAATTSTVTETTTHSPDDTAPTTSQRPPVDVSDPEGENAAAQHPAPTTHPTPPPDQAEPQDIPGHR